MTLFAYACIALACLFAALLFSSSFFFKVLLLLLGTWLVADLATSAAHATAAVLSAPPFSEAVFLDRILPTSFFSSDSSTTASAAAAVVKAFLNRTMESLAAPATAIAARAAPIEGAGPEMPTSQEADSVGSSSGEGMTSSAVITAVSLPWLQTMGTRGWTLLQRGRAFTTVLLEACWASTSRAALVITVLAALLFALLLAPFPINNDDDDDADSASGIEAYVVRQLIKHTISVHSRKEELRE